MRNFPVINRVIRLLLALKLEIASQAFRKTFVGKFIRKALQNMITDYMQRTAPASYHSILIPTFPFGAKRPVMDHGYLESLHDERVTLVKSRSIEIISPKEARLENGQTFTVDVIVLANGFETQQLLTPMSIKGIDAAHLPGIWQQDGQAASAYMGYGLYFPRETC
jgi:cation diffusion facilitator CzcD-associated flavoprotein CzcO